MFNVSALVIGNKMRDASGLSMHRRYVELIMGNPIISGAASSLLKRYRNITSSMLFVESFTDC